MPNLAGFNADSSGEYRIFIAPDGGVLVTVLGDVDAPEVETMVQLLTPIPVEWHPLFWSIDAQEFYVEYARAPYDLRIHDSGDWAIVGGQPFKLEYLESHVGAPGDRSPIESHPPLSATL